MFDLATMPTASLVKLGRGRFLSLVFTRFCVSLSEFFRGGFNLPIGFHEIQFAYSMSAIAIDATNKNYAS
jgi:hypothetical protein